MVALYSAWTWFRIQLCLLDIIATRSSTTKSWQRRQSPISPTNHVRRGRRHHFNEMDEGDHLVWRVVIAEKRTASLIGHCYDNVITLGHDIEIKIEGEMEEKVILI